LIALAGAMLTRNGLPPPTRNQNVWPNIIVRSVVGPPFSRATRSCRTNAAVALQRSLQYGERFEGLALPQLGHSRPCVHSRCFVVTNAL
jgi:hypothetical protein